MWWDIQRGPSHTCPTHMPQPCVGIVPFSRGRSTRHRLRGIVNIDSKCAMWGEDTTKRGTHQCIELPNCRPCSDTSQSKKHYTSLCLFRLVVARRENTLRSRGGAKTYHFHGWAARALPFFRPLSTSVPRPCGVRYGRTLPTT